MSHELRTPLNSILALSELLAMNKHKGMSKEEIEFANVINSSGKDLLELINDILNPSKVEAGKMRLDQNQDKKAEKELLQSYSDERQDTRPKMEEKADKVGKNKKTLIIDDDMRNVFVLTKILEGKEVKIVVGKSGDG